MIAGADSKLPIRVTDIKISPEIGCAAKSLMATALGESCHIKGVDSAVVVIAYE